MKYIQLTLTETIGPGVANIAGPEVITPLKKPGWLVAVSKVMAPPSKQYSELILDQLLYVHEPVFAFLLSNMYSLKEVLNLYIQKNDNFFPNSRISFFLEKLN